MAANRICGFDFCDQIPSPAPTSRRPLLGMRHTPLSIRLGSNPAIRRQPADRLGWVESGRFRLGPRRLPVARRTLYRRAAPFCYNAGSSRAPKMFGIFRGGYRTGSITGHARERPLSGGCQRLRQNFANLDRKLMRVVPVARLARPATRNQEVPSMSIVGRRGCRMSGRE